MAAPELETGETLEAAACAEQPETEAADAGAISPYAVALWGIFALLLLFALYFARSVALPVALAALASLVLAPVVRGMRRVVRVPPPIAAAVLLLGLLGSLLYGVYALSGPAADWMQRAPESAREVERKLRFLRQPVAGREPGDAGGRARGAARRGAGYARRRHAAAQPLGRPPRPDAGLPERAPRDRRSCSSSCSRRPTTSSRSS